MTLRGKVDPRTEACFVLNVAETVVEAVFTPLRIRTSLVAGVTYPVFGPRDILPM